MDISTLLSTQFKGLSLTGNAFVDTTILLWLVPRITVLVTEFVYMVYNFLTVTINKFIVSRFYTSISINGNYYMFLYFGCVYFDPDEEQNNVLVGSYRFTVRTWTYTWIDSIQFKPSTNNEDSDERFVTFKGKVFRLTIKGGKFNGQVNDQLTLTVQCFGHTKEDFLIEFFQDVAEKYKTLLKKRVSIVGNDDKPCSIRKKSLESLFLPPEIKDRLIKDIQSFVDQVRMYEKRQIPYQRGYLLYGPPGTGKSSIVKAVASMFDFEIVEIDLCNDDQKRLRSRLSSQSAKMQIILFEDIDAAFPDEIKKSNTNPELAILEDLKIDKKPSTSMTYSSLLNCLNGVGVDMNGKLIFMTTNFYNLLPPSLIRAGRIDMRLNINYMRKEELTQMLQYYYQGFSDRHIQTLANKLSKYEKITPAEVQSFCISKTDIKDAIESVKYFRLYE
jgi:hypothetical protein